MKRTNIENLLYSRPPNGSKEEPSDPGFEIMTPGPRTEYLPLVTQAVTWPRMKRKLQNHQTILTLWGLLLAELLTTGTVISGSSHQFSFPSICIYFWERDRESACELGRGREREGERESQAGSTLSAQSLRQALNPQTVRSWAEPKTRVRILNRLSRWGAPVPSSFYYFIDVQIEGRNYEPMGNMYKTV